MRSNRCRQRWRLRKRCSSSEAVKRWRAAPAASATWGAGALARHRCRA